MNYLRFNKYSKNILIVLLFMPVIGATMLTLQDHSPEANQNILLQIVYMGIYNLPFLIVAYLARELGKNRYSKSQKQATIALIASTTSSVIGIGVMFIWGLGSA